MRMKMEQEQINATLCCAKRCASDFEQLRKGLMKKQVTELAGELITKHHAAIAAMGVTRTQFMRFIKESYEN